MYNELSPAVSNYVDQTAAALRSDEEAIETLAAELGLDEEGLRTALNEVHGKTLVKNVLADSFPRTMGEPIEEAGYLHQTAAALRSDEGAIETLAAELGLDEDDLRTALNEVHGKTLLKNVLADSFPHSINEPIEEADEEGSTGVEEETETVSVMRPYNPDEIRVDPKPFSLKQVLDEIADGGIDLAPDFQRNRVWNEKQRVRLIESVLLRIPLPAFYFSADHLGRLSVVDGVQRLSTIKSFVAGEFSLTRKSLEYLDVTSLKPPSSKGPDDRCSFDELELQWRLRLNRTQITANVIDPQTPEQVKFDIFKRINTGGSPLNAQEIRHSMMRDRSRNLLKRLTNLPEFLDATPRKIHHHRRMADREVVLRYLAFVQLGDFNDYPIDSTMDTFLMGAVRELDNERTVSNDQLKSLETDFRRAMLNAQLVFGEHAFRKWPLDRPRLFPFNKALFESWGFALRQASSHRVERSASRIAAAAREAFDDPDYDDSITASTGAARSVKRRFEVSTTLVEENLT